MSNSKLQAEKFIEDFKSFTSKEIANEIDVFNLLESIFRSERTQLLEDIAFTSKYCTGLINIIKKSSNEVNEEYKKEHEKNLSESIETLKQKFGEILEYFDPYERESFSARYLELSYSSLNKLFSLIRDLSEIKIYLNAKKRMH